MNKEFYVQTQIKSAFINKVLLENDAEESLRIFISNFDFLSISDVIDSYLSFPTNMLFLSYFDDIRNKLKEVLEMYTFKLNSCDDDYLIDEVYATQSDIIEMINLLNYEKKKNNSEIEETLLAARGIDTDFNLDRDKFLRACYANDYQVFLCINSLNGKIEYQEKDYVTILMSLYYYFNQIVFTTNDKIAKSNLDVLLEYKCTGEEKEFFDYYKELIKRSYKKSLNIDYDTFIEENLEEDEETKKERLKNINNCKIYDFEKCKTKTYKNKKGE